MSGLLYLASALVLGGIFMYWAVVLLRANNPKAPIQTFRYSIVYLMLLFVMLLVDHYVPGANGLPEATVASVLGYATPSNFARAFERWTGQTPTNFRRTV